MTIRKLLYKSVEIPVTCVILGCIGTLVVLSIADAAVEDWLQREAEDRVFG